MKGLKSFPQPGGSRRVKGAKFKLSLCIVFTVPSSLCHHRDRDVIAFICDCFVKRDCGNLIDYSPAALNLLSFILSSHGQSKGPGLLR